MAAGRLAVTRTMATNSSDRVWQIGAAFGALGFLSSPYRTVYKSK
jgi:hypothetical protein